MWKGKLTFETSTIFSIGFLVTFLLGGLAGMRVGPQLDFRVTDSYFVVWHFHSVLFGAIMFGAYAGKPLLVVVGDGQFAR